jgi:hypothetical protein
VNAQDFACLAPPPNRKGPYSTQIHGTSVHSIKSGPPLGPSFVGHVSITTTPSVRGLDRLLADKPLSTGRLSEYPTDYFVGICIETSAMAQQNTLWLPRVDFSECRLRLPVLEE